MLPRQIVFARLLLVGGALTISLASCQDGVGPTTIAHISPELPNSHEGCWPISPECQHRMFDPYESNRVFTQILAISNTYGVCQDIQNRLLNDFEVGNILMWTDGPPEYHPDDHYGDTNNGPGVVHLTANAFVGETNLYLQQTLIHEAVHRLGILDDYQAEYWAEMCYEP
jgi:hypothetical protein